MNAELKDWLDNNRIQYTEIDDEVFEVPEFGKIYFEETDKLRSIFHTTESGELTFNYAEDPKALLNEGIGYIAFKFGDNFYYFALNGKGFQLNILKYIGPGVANKEDMPFVNLGVHTCFELLNGSFQVSDWIRKAKFLGHSAIGVCDHNTMGALFQLQKDASAAGIKPIFGYSLTVSEGFSGKVYVGSQTGLRNLLRIQKAIMVDSPDKTIQFTELLKRGKGNTFVFDTLSAQYMVDNIQNVYLINEAFDATYYQVDMAEYKAERIDIQVLNSLKLYFEKLYPMANLIAPVLISDCYYLDRDDAKNKIILNKIADGAAHRQSDQQYFKSISEHYADFKALFSEAYDVDVIFKECCENTLKIAEAANASFETTRNYMPKYDLTDEEKVKYGTAHNMFCQLLEEGLQKLVPEEKREQYRKQMEYEKYVIESTDNVDYLLVQYDTVNWCRRNNILVGCGRGSAAGSLLLYLLGITLVDPIKYDLIFERFLLPERAGLYPAQATKFSPEEETATQYVEVTMENGKTLYLDKDSTILIQGENGEPTQMYADELMEGDDIIFDNRDLIFEVNG